MSCSESSRTEGDPRPPYLTWLGAAGLPQLRTEFGPKMPLFAAQLYMTYVVWRYWERRRAPEAAPRRMGAGCRAGKVEPRAVLCEWEGGHALSLALILTTPVSFTPYAYQGSAFFALSTFPLNLRAHPADSLRPPASRARSNIL